MKYKEIQRAVSSLDQTMGTLNTEESVSAYGDISVDGTPREILTAADFRTPNKYNIPPLQLNTQRTMSFTQSLLETSLV